MDLQIKDLSDLSKMIDLARKKGVKSFKVDGIEVELREAAPPSNYKRKDSETTKIDPTYTDTDALLWSSAGIPEHFFDGAS